MKTILKIFSTFFGIGFIPIAPGTVASALVVILYKYFLCHLPWPFYLTLIFLFFLAGTFSASNYSAKLKQKDPRKIVVDEACGQLLILFRIPASWVNLLLAFALFRIFDIIKPYPIKKIERFPDGWGIMTDDLVASIYGAILIHLYLFLK